MTVTRCFTRGEVFKRLRTTKIIAGVGPESLYSLKAQCHGHDGHIHFYN